MSVPPQQTERVFRVGPTRPGSEVKRQKKDGSSPALDCGRAAVIRAAG
jgi:hypothetical protein